MTDLCSLFSVFNTITFGVLFGIVIYFYKFGIKKINVSKALRIILSVDGVFLSLYGFANGIVLFLTSTKIFSETFTSCNVQELNGIIILASFVTFGISIREFLKSIKIKKGKSDKR